MQARKVSETLFNFEDKQILTMKNKQQTVYALSSLGYFPTSRPSNHPSIISANERSVHLTYIRCNEIFKGESKFLDSKSEEFYRLSRSLPAKSNMTKSEITNISKNADENFKNLNQIRVNEHGSKHQKDHVARSVYLGTPRLTLNDLEQSQIYERADKKYIHLSQQIAKPSLHQNYLDLPTFQSQILSRPIDIEQQGNNVNKHENHIKSLDELARLQKSIHSVQAARSESGSETPHFGKQKGMTTIFMTPRKDINIECNSAQIYESGCEQKNDGNQYYTINRKYSKDRVYQDNYGSAKQQNQMNNQKKIYFIKKKDQDMEEEVKRINYNTRKQNNKQEQKIKIGQQGKNQKIGRQNYRKTSEGNQINQINLNYRKYINNTQQNRQGSLNSQNQQGSLNSQNQQGSLSSQNQQGSLSSQLHQNQQGSLSSQLHQNQQGSLSSQLHQNQQGSLSSQLHQNQQGSLSSQLHQNQQGSLSSQLHQNQQGSLSSQLHQNQQGSLSSQLHQNQQGSLSSQLHQNQQGSLSSQLHQNQQGSLSSQLHQNQQGSLSSQLHQNQQGSLSSQLHQNQQGSLSSQLHQNHQQQHRNQNLHDQIRSQIKTNLPFNTYNNFNYQTGPSLSDPSSVDRDLYAQTFNVNLQNPKPPMVQTPSKSQKKQPKQLSDYQNFINNSELEYNKNINNPHKQRSLSASIKPSPSSPSQPWLPNQRPGSPNSNNLEQLNNLKLQLARKQRQIREQKIALQASQKKNRSLELQIKKLQTNNEMNSNSKYSLVSYSNISSYQTNKYSSDIAKEVGSYGNAFMLFVIFIVMLGKEKTGK